MRSLLLVTGILLASACAATSTRSTHVAAPHPPDHAEGKSVGLLVMAHGGAPEWNRAVDDALEPLRREIPTALALGMADPETLQAALDSLVERGVEEVAVVRLFLSGASFRHQTRYLLGLRPDPPAEPLVHGAGSHAGGGHEAALRPLRVHPRIHLSREGVAASGVAREIARERARTIARDPRRTRVLLLAHGMGDEGENGRLLRNMERAAEKLRDDGFAEVRVATLREDWPDVRAAAERDIRAWVGAAPPGQTTLVVPYRLYGFGPYARVLDGLGYVRSQGLLPHPLITQWVRSTAASTLCAGGVEAPWTSCALTQEP